MPKGRSFIYQERSRDDVRERANARGGNFDDYIKSSFKKLKVKDGKNVIRILPPTWPKAKHYGYDIWVNYGIGADNQSYLSLSKMKGGSDPIAEAQREASREGDEKLARELSPRHRILMWVIDRLAEEEGPQIWASPFTFDKDLAAISYDEDTNEVVMIDEPETGCDVRFYREGTGLNTKYPAAKIKLMQEGPISQDEQLQAQWLEYIQQNPLPNCLQFYDYDYIASIFEGQARSTPDETSDETPPWRGRGVQEQTRVSPRSQPRRPASNDPEPDAEGNEEAETTLPTNRPNGAQRTTRPSQERETTSRRARPSVTDPVPDESNDEPPQESIRDRIKRRKQEILEASGGDED